MAEEYLKEHQESISRDVEISLSEYFAVLRPHWWKIFFLSFFVGVVTLIWMFKMPNLYRASATITPAVEERKQNSALRSLASFGVSVGIPDKVEDLELLFKSDDLTVRVFTRHDHWMTILGDDYDPTTGKVKTGWLASLFGGKKEAKPPGDWSAIRAARDAMSVTLNRMAGSLILSFETTSPDESASILNEYLDEAKSRLQEEAFVRAEKNKKFIEEQIGKTVDALTRDRLYALLGQEVEREMMARNREQFGFRVIDSPRVPDRHYRPQRGRIIATMMFLSFILGCIFIGYFERKRKNLYTRNTDNL